MTIDTTVRNLSEILRFDGKRGHMIGEYRVVARPTRGKKSAPADYAVLILEDGSEVFLEAFATPEAQRSETERNRFNGRTVRVEGIIYRRMPNIGQGPMAPSVCDITSIEEAGSQNKQT